MRIDRLELDFFRNYVHLEAAFDPSVNVIYGDNAQGKTNLLEAVGYLSGHCCKWPELHPSYRPA